MLTKIMSFLKSGQFWTGFVAGVVVASAVPFVRNLGNKAAAVIPGAKVSG